MPITIDLETDPLFLEGAEKAKREDVIKLYKKLHLKPKQIAEILEIDEKKVKTWLKEEGLLKENNP